MRIICLLSVMLGCLRFLLFRDSFVHRKLGLRRFYPQITQIKQIERGKVAGTGHLGVLLFDKH